MYKNKKTGLIGIIITVIILIIVVFISNMDNKNISYIENIFNSLVMPVQNGLVYLKNKISGNDSFFADVNSLRQENEELKKKNSELEQELREFEILKAENETLKEYVNLKDKYKEFETIPAYIINKDISNYSKNIIINAGSDDGIEENMTVIADKGLVGFVISTTPTTAKVQTIIDPSTSVSGLLGTSRDPIVVNGTIESDNTLKATFIPTDANLSQGDIIETSGLGGIYPKGIQVGKITQVVETKNITDRYAIVETSVDFDKLETVLVITNK